MAVSLTLVFGDAEEREAWMDEHGFQEPSSDDTSVILVIDSGHDLDDDDDDSEEVEPENLPKQGPDDMGPDDGELDPVTAYEVWRSWCAGS